MSLGSRLELVALCDQIGEAVKGQNLSYGHDRNGYLVSVAAGRQAEAEREFLTSVKEYMQAKWRGKGEELTLRDKLAAAVEKWADDLGPGK